MRRSAALFIVIALAQLAAPAWMVVSHERILQEGEVFKFRTAPIDPRDPFRGEYVVLNFEASDGSWSDPHEVPASTTDQAPYVKQTSFASLGVSDSSGFAIITGLSATPPPSGAYIEVKHWGTVGSSITNVELPFDRCYLEEGDGAQTESMLMPQWEDGQMSQPLPAYAVVRVYNGKAVIEDLIVGHQSIHEWLKEQ